MTSARTHAKHVLPLALIPVYLVYLTTLLLDHLAYLHVPPTITQIFISVAPVKVLAKSVVRKLPVFLV